MMPGNPFSFTNEETNEMYFYSQEQIEALEKYYGIEGPLYHQYFIYISNIFKGDFGVSIYYGKRVLNIIYSRLPWTIIPVLIATIMSVIVGCFLGACSAFNRNKILDNVLYPVMLFLSQVPNFIIGTILLFVLAGLFGLFPLSGGKTPFLAEQGLWILLKDLAYHAALPLATMLIMLVPDYYFITRNSMISVLGKDYIRTANAKGLSNDRIIFRHALPNAIQPIIAKMFLGFGTIMGGAVIIESVFKYPGIGLLMREAVFNRDYPLIQGIFFVMAVFVFTMNTISDLTCKNLDPRLK
jgi:peptide/nickel transport system permease protein